MLNYDDVKRIVEEGSEQTLTLYLQVDPAVQENQATQPAWRIWLKDSLDYVEKTYMNSDDGKQIWRHLFPMVREFFDTYRPNSKSLVLFYSPDKQQSFELPFSIEENRVFYGIPAVAPLLWAMDEFEPYLVVLVDREKALFFNSYLGSGGHQETLRLQMDQAEWVDQTMYSGSIQAGQKGDAGVPLGGQQEQYEDRVDEQIHKFYREVAQRMYEMTQQRTFERIILGGNEQSAHAVHDYLHETVKQEVIGITSVSMKLSANDVLSQVQPMALEYERKRELELVQEVIDFAKSGGRGALGESDVLMALEQQRVELLLVSWPVRDEVLMDTLSVKTMQSSGQFELVHGVAAERLNEEGGIGARLYYAIQPATENA